MAKSGNDVMAWWNIATTMQDISMSATEVIWRRSVMMATGSMSQSEAFGMFDEKSSALLESWSKAATAQIQNAPPTKVLGAALKPFSKKTSANARRLRKRS